VRRPRPPYLRPDPFRVALLAPMDDLLLFEAGPRLRRVRVLLWAAAACAAAALYGAWDLALHYGLSPGDGGVLRPLGQRLAWAAGVGSLGLAALVGMWVYSRTYVAALRYDGPGGFLIVRTPSWLGTRAERVSVADLAGATHRDAKRLAQIGNAHGLTVDAPWLSVRVRGRRLPLVVDLQGRFPDPGRLGEILRRKAAA
jgi:hypothetical protein